eukprot:403706-Amphidinium_carterae.1
MESSCLQVPTLGNLSLSFSIQGGEKRAQLSYKSLAFSLCVQHATDGCRSLIVLAELPVVESVAGLVFTRLVGRHIVASVKVGEFITHNSRHVSHAIGTCPHQAAARLRPSFFKLLPLLSTWKSLDNLEVEQASRLVCAMPIADYCVMTCGKDFRLSHRH